MSAEPLQPLHYDLPLLGDVEPTVTTSDVGDGWQHVRLTWQLERPVEQAELTTTFTFGFEPDIWWAPHLTPSDTDCIAQHVFRSPALIAAKGGDVVAIVPELEICGTNPQTPWFMDLDVPAQKAMLGFCHATVPEHVRFEKTGTLTLPPGQVSLGFYWIAYTDKSQPLNPWHRVGQFLWNRYGQPLHEQGQPSTVPLDRYLEHTYKWAFETWVEPVWQEFELDGRTVGGATLIVSATQSPNYSGEPELREFPSVWNQAWFSSLRSASGLYRYALRTGDDALRERANLTKELALAAPMDNGLFPSVYRTEMEEVIEGDGKPYMRSSGWETGYWTNSNRTPVERGVTDEWYHIVDSSWTALLMLRWHEELDKDERLLDYSRRYAERLLTLQDDDGHFPAWLHPATHEPSDVLRQSPETSMSVTFLLMLSRITGEDRYRDAAIRAMDAVLVEIVPDGRWEDFETYWSCSRIGREEFYGRKIPRNALYKQNTLSMFWTAEALLDTYRATNDQRYLNWGRRTLDELSMFQQVWQPPFIYIRALGGFGVMNLDGEWNDSRQCLFAELYMDYYRETGERALFERGIVALKSAFAMMYCPENPEAKGLWEKVWPHFGPDDYGFMMENYGHGGITSPEGRGIGPFTIYDWGNGAASEARSRIRDHYGDVYIDRQRGHAFGIDSITAVLDGDTCHVRDLAGTDRPIRVVVEAGTSGVLMLDNGQGTIPNLSNWATDAAPQG